jgi:hypothetical protein
LENQKTQRLLYDTECKDCEHKAMCEHVDTSQRCRAITDKLRVELKNNRKHREIVAKISIITEYIYDNISRRLIKNVADKGTFVLQEPYIFGKPFLRAEIDGECNGGTFKTVYCGWNK